ncbi:MAG: ribbon-helix-helix domain-containing protein [Nitrospirales bacterium]|nr:ribbon-helix-helix domain-containing protein [Nitrospirales bacterium]
MGAMTKVLIHLPKPLKARLDALKAQGYTASGFIRALLERELSQGKKKGG